MVYLQIVANGEGSDWLRKAELGNVVTEKAAFDDENGFQRLLGG